MKLLIKFYVKLIYAIRAIKNIGRPKLGDIVTYKGERYVLIQGVADPLWDLFNREKGRINYVPKDQFELQPLYKRFWFSFTFTYRFFMGYWYMIDVNNNGKFTFKGN